LSYFEDTSYCLLNVGTLRHPYAESMRLLPSALVILFLSSQWGLGWA